MKKGDIGMPIILLIIAVVFFFTASPLFGETRDNVNDIRDTARESKINSCSDRDPEHDFDNDGLHDCCDVCPLINQDKEEVLDSDKDGIPFGCLGNVKEAMTYKNGVLDEQKYREFITENKVFNKYKSKIEDEERDADPSLKPHYDGECSAGLI